MLNGGPVCQAHGFSGSVLDSVDFSCYWCAFSNGSCKPHAVTKKARIGGVTCDAFNNESAFIDVATPA